MKQRTLFLTLVLVGAVLIAAGCTTREDGTQPRLLVNPDQGPIGGDPAPPSTPTGIFIDKVDANGFSMSWFANEETNVAGYRIYRFDAGQQDTPFVLQNTDALVAVTNYVYTGDMTGGVWISVSAVDDAGRESIPSEPVLVQAPKNTTPSQPDPNAGGDNAGMPDLPQAPDSGRNGGTTGDGTIDPGMQQ